jgi:hypothetical protein
MGNARRKQGGQVFILDGFYNPQSPYSYQKALEAEEKRISPSRGFNCIEKAQTSALPFSRILSTLLPLFQTIDRGANTGQNLPLCLKYELPKQQNTDIF